MHNISFFNLHYCSSESKSGAMQHCVTYLKRNVFSHVPRQTKAEVAENFKAIATSVKVCSKKTAKTLVEEFVSLYEKRYPKAVSVFAAGVGDALPYLGYPRSHHSKIRTTNVLERLLNEVKRRTKVVEAFPNET